MRDFDHDTLRDWYVRFGAALGTALGSLAVWWTGKLWVGLGAAVVALVGAVGGLVIAAIRNKAER